MGISRYPRYGQPLVPRALAELLQVRIPAGRLGKEVASAVHLSELDQTVWSRFSHQVCVRLAARVVKEMCWRVATAARLPLENGASVADVFRRPLPQLPAGLRLEDLQLEQRTYNCPPSRNACRFSEVKGLEE